MKAFKWFFLVCLVYCYLIDSAFSFDQYALELSGKVEVRYSHFTHDKQGKETDYAELNFRPEMIRSFLTYIMVCLELHIKDAI